MKTGGFRDHRSGYLEGAQIFEILVPKSTRRPGGRGQEPSERLVRDIRRATRKQYSAEEKIRIVLDGLRGEVTIAELSPAWGIAESLLRLVEGFLEAGKRRLAGDTALSRDPRTRSRTCAARQQLKEVVAEQALELRLLKKSMTGDGGDEE